MNDRITIIIPVLDAAALLPATLGALQDLRQRGHEVLVVDGGSRDGSVTIARRLADRVLLSGPSRALQMNAGAESARHEILLFLHVDTALPPDADALIGAALQPPGRVWGGFEQQAQLFSNWHARLAGVVKGGQALFVARTWFERVGGFDAVPREDVALSRKLRRHGPPVRIRAVVRKVQPGPAPQ